MSDGDDEGIARGLARLAGGLFVDELTNGAVFFSLILIVGAVVTANPPFVALGVAAGLAGMVLPWRGLHLGWADATMTLVAVAVLIADGGTGWLLWVYS